VVLKKELVEINDLTEKILKERLQSGNSIDKFLEN